MEWVEGPTLSRALKKTPLARGDALRLVERVARAVGCLHRRGIVHRDIKPGNILLEGGDPAKPKLIDLGIARAETEDALTMTGVIVGTVGFMAPEQASGERTIDARADVYALGCLLFKCVTGGLPFMADEPLAVLLRLALEEAPRLASIEPTVSPELDAFVARMLSRRPAGRPRDGNEVAAALSMLVEDDAPASRASLPDVSAVTTTESRLAFLVLGRTSGLESGRASPSFASLARSLASVGLRPELLVDGTLVVVVSGTSTTAGDLALRAARAALSVRAVLPESVGVVTTGRSAFGAPHLMGEAIERGSSLLGRVVADGHPGDIVLDDSTARLLGERFEIGARDGRNLLVSERGAPALSVHPAGGFVGRSRELGFLRTLAEEVALERRARVALVLGAAGVGKSRLVSELVKYVSLGAAEVWIAQGDPLASQSPLGLLRPLFARLAGISRGDSSAAAFARIEALAKRTVDASFFREVADFLGELVGVPTVRPASPALAAARRDATLMGDQLRRAVTAVFRGRTAQRPLVFVLEDLQWADQATVSFLETALRSLEETPLLVIGVARPDVRTAHPRFLEGRGVDEVSLGPLSPRASRSLALELSSSDRPPPDDLVERIVERAAGNPFFLEELVRAANAGDASELPDSVLTILDARLDALPSDARRVLRAASVFGKSFWTSAVEALVPSIDCARELAFLERTDVIVLAENPRFDLEEEWTFKSALLVDAAYARLPVKDRERAHLSAAKWLESAGEGDPAILAVHFEKGGDPKSATSLLSASAQLALEATDLPQAVSLAERAIACGAGGADAGALRAIVAEASLWLGRNKEALVAAREALALLEPERRFMVSRGGSGSRGRAAHRRSRRARCDRR